MKIEIESNGQKLTAANLADDYDTMKLAMHTLLAEAEVQMFGKYEKNQEKINELLQGVNLGEDDLEKIRNIYTMG